MSNNIDLLDKSVGKEKDEKAEQFNPIENLKTLSVNEGSINLI